MSRGIEAKLQDKFINFLKRNNILYVKTSGGMSWLPDGKGNFFPIRHKEGFADVFIFTNLNYVPNTIFIEIKTDDGKLRDTQIEKFEKLTDLGFECLILRPRHWENCKAKGKINLKNLLEEMERF